MKIIYTLCFLVGVVSLNAQTLTWFHVDEVPMQPAGFRYYNDVQLAHDKIAYSYMTQPRYNPSLYGFGDVAAKLYDTDGNFIEQSSSQGDSLFIRKTLLLASGDKIVLVNGYAHYALYDLDTTVALNQFGEVKSYIHHLDENDNTIRFTACDDVMDIVMDENENQLYFVNLYNYNEADVQRMNIASGEVATLAYIYGARSYPVLIKTHDYLYVTGATIEPQVHIDDDVLDVDFDYTNVLIQFNNDGTYNWVRQLEDVTASPVGMAASLEQGVYFSSNLYDAIAIGGHSMQGPTWGSDFYITRIDASGNFLWVTEAPNNTICDFNVANGFHLDCDDEYNVYIAGSTRKLLVWDDGTTVGRDTNVATPTMLKFDSNGNLIGHIVAEAGQEGSFYSMDVSGSGDLVFSGLINSTFTFSGQTKTVSDELFHPFVLYYKNVTSGVSQLDKQEDDFYIYPNLLSTNQTIQIRKNNLSKEWLYIYDLNGRMVHSQMIEGFQYSMSFPSLTAGSYIVQVGERKGNRVMVK